MSQECIICLDDNYTRSNPSVCFFSDKCSCNAIVHRDCIVTWINTNPQNRNKCPVCRTRGQLLPIPVSSNNEPIDTTNNPIQPSTEVPYYQINDVEIGLANNQIENINNEELTCSNFFRGVGGGFILVISGIFYSIYLIFYGIFFLGKSFYEYIFENDNIQETFYKILSCILISCFLFIIISALCCS